MKLTYMDIEVKYGNIIHDDGTVIKRTTTKYETIQDLRQAWNNLSKSRNDYMREANIKELTIEIREYVPVDEYFDLYDMSQEEEE
tara:strand:+ start:184 stop:438 length:255 start_codon:yes stop_codon:yes gene_type:complete